MPNFFRFVIDFPALDRLMNYLEAAQQGQIDSATKQVQQLTKLLRDSQNALQGAIKKEQ